MQGRAHPTFLINRVLKKNTLSQNNFFPAVVGSSGEVIFFVFLSELFFHLHRSNGMEVLWWFISSQEDIVTMFPIMVILFSSFAEFS